MEVVVHCFVTGSDAEAANGNPRRFRYSDNPDPTNWVKVHQFVAFRTQLAGTVPIYVSEAGGGQTRPGGDPHRNRVAFNSGVPSGWTRDHLVFYAYNTPQHGTVPHYVLERGGGDPAAGDPNRSEISTNPCPAPGWGLKMTFYAVPTEDPNRMPIHVYIAGDDSRAGQGDPRRANVSLDGVTPGQQGWTKVMEFKAYRNPVSAGSHDSATVQYFVSEAGGGPTVPGGNPNRYRIHTNSGVPMGWTRDNFTFHAYPRPTPGTIPFYVMERGGGDPAAGDPNRCEITMDPRPLPGWHVMSTFYAFPSFNPQLTEIYGFVAGDDSRANLGDPKRFKYVLDGSNSPKSGWYKSFQFKAFLSCVGGTTQYFVSEAGGGDVRPGGDPNRYRVATNSGHTCGWARDVFSFFAYATPTAGTAPFYVMERGGGDPAAGDPNRYEVTQNPNPAPGWRCSLTFYAYPSTMY